MPAKPLRVLVAEDDLPIRRVAELTLASLGCEVVGVVDGLEILERCIAQGESFDLAIVDAVMPHVDGIEAIARLRDHGPTRELPVVCMSSKAFGPGCDASLKKPFTRPELVEAAEAALRARGKLGPGERLG